MEALEALEQGATDVALVEAHATAAAELAASADRPRPVTRVGYAHITRVDAARREIELCATSEAVDSYGIVFDCEASKDVFTRWLDNIREIHERRAVGRWVGVRFDDAARKVFVHVRISRGAQDTGEKQLDGALRGAAGRQHRRRQRSPRPLRRGLPAGRHVHAGCWRARLYRRQQPHG